MTTKSSKTRTMYVSTMETTCTTFLLRIFIVEMCVTIFVPFLHASELRAVQTSEDPKPQHAKFSAV